MEIGNIISIVYYCLAAAMVLVSMLVSFIKLAKARKDAKTKEEKEAIEEEMKTQAKEFIQAAEIAYKDVNDLLKSKGSSAGSIKLDSVLSKLQNLASEKNYSFDVTYWTNYINKEVAFSRNVNAEEK